MANIDLQSLINAAADGDTITWTNADTLLDPTACVAPAGALGWLVNKELYIKAPHPRRNTLGACGAKCTFPTGGGSGNNNGFRLATLNGNITIEGVILRGPGTAASVTGTGCGIYVEPLMRTTLSRSSTTNSSTTLTVTPTTDLFPGCPVSGTGIQPGTTITAVAGGSVTLSLAATDATTTNRTFGVVGGTRMPHVDIRRCVIWGFGQDGINLDNVDEILIDETDVSGCGRHGVYLKGSVTSVVREGFMASNGGSGLYLDGCVAARILGCSFDGNGRLSGYSDNGQITNRGTSGGGYANMIRDCEFENIAQYQNAHCAISVINSVGTLANSCCLVEGAYVANPADVSVVRSGTCTNLSAAITGLSTTADLQPGFVVSEGSNFAANATILSVDSSSQVTVTGTPNGQYGGSTGSKSVTFAASDAQKTANAIVLRVDASEYVLRPETVTTKAVGRLLALFNGAANGGAGFGSRNNPGGPA